MRKTTGAKKTKPSDPRRAPETRNPVGKRCRIAGVPRPVSWRRRGQRRRKVAEAGEAEKGTSRQNRETTFAWASEHMQGHEDARDLKMKLAAGVRKAAQQEETGENKNHVKQTASASVAHASTRRQCVRDGPRCWGGPAAAAPVPRIESSVPPRHTCETDLLRNPPRRRDSALRNSADDSDPAQ